jgi:four helix bundle protein
MLKTYDVAVQLISVLRPLVPQLARSNRDLADQLRRAASSVVLNLGEGRKFHNGNRGKHYDIAQGSANEVKAALDTAEAWGWLETNAEVRVLLDRLLALLWKLTHSPAVRALSSRE